MSSLVFSNYLLGKRYFDELALWFRCQHFSQAGQMGGGLKGTVDWKKIIKARYRSPWTPPLLWRFNFYTDV